MDEREEEGREKVREMKGREKMDEGEGDGRNEGEAGRETCGRGR